MKSAKRPKPAGQLQKELAEVLRRRAVISAVQHAMPVRHTTCSPYSTPSSTAQERHNLFAARNLTPPDPERQKREDEVMSEVMVLWTRLAAAEVNLTKFVKAKRLG